MLLYLPVFAAFAFVFLPHKRKIGERIWNIACPDCGNYIPLAEWTCLCETHYKGRHILEGCPGDGTRYGSGEDSEIRSVECGCGYELDFYEPYTFEKWTILEKGEESDKEFIPIKRETWLYATGTAFTLVGAITALYFIIKDLPTSHSTPISLFVMITVTGFIALGEIFIFLEPRVFYPKRYIRNPKHRDE